MASFTVTDRSRQLTDAERTIAGQCLLDWLGVALRGAREPTARSAREAVASWSAPHGPATVIGTSMTAGGADAALLNAIAGHVLDYDDTTVGPFEGHPSAPLLPALLSLAETRDVKPARVIEAFAVGHRTASRLGAWANPSHYRRGWHATATLGVFAAAAGCAALLGLDADQTATALALAATHASGLRASFGTPAKAVQVGHAAGDGLRCALLAEQGLRVEGDLLGGETGFLSLHAGRDDGAAAAGLESILVKHHACCHCTHAAIDATAALGLDPDDVHQVEVQAAPSLADVCGIDDPRTGLELKFSLRGLTALALLGADTGDPDTLSDRWALDAGYRRLHDRVRVRYLDGLSEFQAQVTVHTTGGESLTRFADVSVLPMPDERWPRVIAKFRRLSTPVIGTSRAEAIVERVRAFEAQPGVSSLLRCCGAGA